ncbi:ecotropic viral integration site 5 protein-like protein [Pyrus ussuriensis x Pyrus communis]|uniref:glutathione transferase n=2 Tax=Pyrus TaxID=3766 RepID=A0A5N5FRM7_9ROSA|nr:ecotropic viral integration site 5 protein-like protein [Pyrus ussuriensis x Pyrus communis]
MAYKHEELPPQLDSTSSPPPLFDGTTRLYVNYTCPFAQRVWITRNYKGLQDKIKLVGIDLENRPDWYKEKVYPGNKVPSLEHNGKVIGESLDLIKYLENNFEGPSLVPNDNPERKKFGKELLTYVDTFVGSLFRSLKGDTVKAADEQFDYLENALKKFDDGPYLLGQFSLVDIAYIPFVERFQAFLSDVFKYDITAGRPKLAAFLEEINKIEAYKVTKADPKEIVALFKKHLVEEEERSNKWKYFLESVEKSSQSCTPENSDKEELQAEATEQKAKTVCESGEEGNDTISKKTASDLSSERDPEKELKLLEQTETSEVQTWTLIRSSLSSIENMMSVRVRKGRNMKDEQIIVDKDHLPFIEEAASSRMASKDDCEDKIGLDDAFNESKNAFSAENSVSDRHSDGEKVAGTGEAVDVGIEEARVNGAPPEPFFPGKLELESLVHGGLPRDLSASMDNDNSSGVPRKWRRQIEKDIPCTFPGCPALNENGWNLLRRLLLAYVRHNPSVGYCQAMNFFAGLLLLLRPEENAFWTLVGIIHDYFDGYYTEEMTESQVDQLVFEELVGEKFQKLVWDVLLFEGNRPALVTTKDAGDAITLLQLKELRDEHRPAVLAIVEERFKQGQAWKDSKGLSSKLYSPTEEGSTDGDVSRSKYGSCNLDQFLSGLTVSEVDSLPDIQDQVAFSLAEELETALMEIVELDNRRELSARVEQLEQEVAELRQALADKTEQGTAMLKVLMWMEEEQKVTEDARLRAEQEAAAQKSELMCFRVAYMQEKYDKAMSSRTEMEKRVKVAESMLEATLQYESGQAKALSPRQGNTTKKMGILSFGLGWRDRNKGSTDLKSPNQQREPSSPKEKTGEEGKDQVAEK